MKESIVIDIKYAYIILPCSFFTRNIYVSALKKNRLKKSLIADQLANKPQSSN